MLDGIPGATVVAGRTPRRLDDAAVRSAADGVQDRRRVTGRRCSSGARSIRLTDYALRASSSLAVALSAKAEAESTYVPTACACTHPGPSSRREVTDPPPDDVATLQLEELSLQRLAATVAAEPAARGHHAVAGTDASWQSRVDVADRACRTRATSAFGHVAVGGHAPGRNRAHDREHTSREFPIRDSLGAHLPTITRTAT